MNKGFSLFPKAASVAAGEVDELYFFMLAVTAFFTLLVAVLIVVFAVKFRRREGAPPPEKFENARLELLWTVVPLLITVVMFVWGAKVYINLSRIPPNAMEVSVIGKQWMWHTQHPDGRREINRLTVPVGRPVKLTMSSQDVIHAFYLPAFRIKQDVLPGRYSYMWFEATDPGVYPLFCAEYCGKGHSEMIGEVHVLNLKDYEAWLASSADGGSAEQSGALLFQSQGCASCHSGVGPSLAGLYGRKDRPVDVNGHRETIPVVDDAYLRESILAPRAKIAIDPEGKPYNASLMPTFDFKEDQLALVMSYIKTLGKNGTQPGNTMIPGFKMREDNPTPPRLRTETTPDQRQGP